MIYKTKEVSEMLKHQPQPRQCGKESLRMAFMKRYMEALINGEEEFEF